MTRVVPSPERTARDWLDPTMTRQRMSTRAGSNSPSVVTVTDCSSVPTARPITTGVDGERRESSSDRASASCCFLDWDAGL